MFWQSSDSPLGNCAICRNPHPPQARGRPAWWEAQEGLGRGARPAGAGSLLGYVPSSALRKVRERDGENQLLS